MAIRVVRLGSERIPGEGPRLGTVRRPPRGVPKAEFASRNFYDVWFPTLSPSAETLKMGLNAATDREWAGFIKRFRSEMAKPESNAALNLLATLSHYTDFSIGCYCEDESHCHRSVLRELLAERGAKLK
jgi:uncharacterized protein YeaO (DUF488 family)